MPVKYTSSSTPSALASSLYMVNVPSPIIISLAFSTLRFTKAKALIRCQNPFTSSSRPMDAMMGPSSFQGSFGASARAFACRSAISNGLYKVTALLHPYFFRSSSSICLAQHNILSARLTKSLIFPSSSMSM